MIGSTRIGLAVGLITVIVAVSTGVGASQLNADAGLPAQGIGTRAVHILLDVSGSMGETDEDGTVLLVGAKRAVTALLDGLPSTIRTGLRAYPADGATCGPGRLEAGFFESRQRVDARARALRAGGGTPTDEALAAAADDLREAGFGGSGSIVLISDGESNCSQDPCDVAKEITASGIDITVNTIGFRISPAGAAELSCIADATGGVYRDAASAEDLVAELGALANSQLALEVTAPAVVIRSVGVGQNRPIRVRAVVSNPSPNTAVAIRVSISVTSERRPFVLNPVRQIGNLEPGDRRTVDWTFTPPLDFSDATVSFVVNVAARNAESISDGIDIRLRGALSLADAGPLLAERSNVVVMGDSYSSGEGAGSYIPPTDTADNPCHRSTLTYGADLWPDQINLACSGAVTAHLKRPQYASTPPQLDALRELTSAPDLVLLTLGGNDVGFREIILACLAPGDCHTKRVASEISCDAGGPLIDQSLAAEIRAQMPSAQLGQPCYRDHGPFGDLKFAEAAGVVSTLIDSYLAIDEVLNSEDRLRERGGPAPIVVLAYPSPVPDPARYSEVLRLCPGLFSYDEWVWIDQFQTLLNAAIGTAVTHARQRGVPIFFASEVGDAFEPSHTICDDVSYINALSYDDYLQLAQAIDDHITAAGRDWISRGATRLHPNTSAAQRRLNESFHPTADGYRAMTAALMEFSRTPRAAEPVRRSRETTSPSIAPPTINLALAPDEPVSVTPGTHTHLTVSDLLPGSLAQAWISSTPKLMDVAVVDADGTVVLDIELAASFPAGAHTLTIATIDATASPSVRSWPLEVSVSGPWAERVSPAVAAVAAVIAVLALALVGLILHRRRRRRSRHDQIDSASA